MFGLFGSLFLGAVGKVEAVPAQLPAGTRCVVLAMHRLIMIDTSGIDALQRSQIALVLANVNPQPLGLIRRSGFEASLGAENIVPSVADPVGDRAQETTGGSAAQAARPPRPPPAPPPPPPTAP